MAIKTFYFKDAVPAGATLHRSLQDGGTPPSAATTTTGWNAGSNAIGQACLMVGGTEVARGAATWGTTLQPSAAPSTTLGDCWRSENTLNGTFANTNWTFNFNLISVTAAYTGRVKLAVRVWRSTNASGASATELTSGRVASAATTASLSTVGATGVSFTWSPGATKTLANEYLFINVGVEVTTAGGGTTQDMDFMVGLPSTTVTPDFTPPTTDDPETRPEPPADDDVDLDPELLEFNFDWINAILVPGPQTYNDGVAEGAATAADTPSLGPTTSVGRINEGPVNLLTYTEDFVSWVPTRISVTGNATTDPLGGSTADKCIPSTSSGAHFVSQAPVEFVSDSAQYRVSVYAKAAGYNWLEIRIQNKASSLATASFDLSTGTKTVAGSTIESVGSGWYRCSVRHNMFVGSDVAAGTAYFYIENADNSGAAYAGDGTSGIYLWGAQRETEGSGLPLATFPAPYDAVPSFRAEQDTVSAASVSSASVAEGSASATDTTDGSVPRQGRVAWIRFFAPPSSGTIQSASDSEGGVTAADTPSAVATLNSAVAEGSATAADTPSAKATFAASVAEGTATATDTPSAKATFAATAAEGTATAVDTPSAAAALAASVVEGTATAIDTSSADTAGVLSAAIVEGTATALDTPSAALVQAAAVAEGGATASDTPDATATLGPQTYNVSVAEGGPTAQDTVSATGGGAAGPTYGGVWMYGLKHYRALRGEEEPEPEPEVVEAVASVVRRTPLEEQDAASRILLRLEAEAAGRAWRQVYLDTLEAYRAGYQDELRAQDAARRAEVELALEAELRAQIELARAREALLKRRRIAAFLLLES